MNSTNGIQDGHPMAAIAQHEYPPKEPPVLAGSREAAPHPDPNPEVAPIPTPADPSAVFHSAPPELIAEILSFQHDSCGRYEFNNRWDNFLIILGIVLSIAVVGAGFLKKPLVSAVLGAFIGAIVTAQKAFPFGSRAAFYRLLVGQAQNLFTRATYQIVDKKAVINALSSLRIDFAQQLPRGSSTQPLDTSTSTVPKFPFGTDDYPKPSVGGTTPPA